MGHDYIGINIAPDYIAYAQERLDNSEAELETARLEIARHIVNDPFQNRKDRGTVSWPFAPQHIKKKTSGETSSGEIDAVDSEAME